MSAFGLDLDRLPCAACNSILTISMRLLRPLVLAWRRLFATLSLRRGIQHFSTGDLIRAAALIHHSMILQGPTFRAHLFLGRIYLRQNRLDRSRQEFARARALDPGRFALQGAADELLLEMARRIQVRQPVPGRVARRPVKDDFSSAAERRRFKVLPPLQVEELERVDWDEAASLFEE
jgi:hypothetical protein